MIKENCRVVSPLLPWLIVVASLSVCLPFTTPSAEAQTTITPQEIKRKTDRDNSLTAEKLERVKAEAVSVQNAILGLMNEKHRKYKIVSSRLSGPETGALGRRGQMVFQGEWKRGKAHFEVNVNFTFSPEEAETFHRKELLGVQMGEEFRPPELFGKDAVLIKNVQFNRSMTWVTLRFRKGRLRVFSSYTNASRSNAENEKAMIEIMEAIYPALVAKERFEDV